MSEDDAWFWGGVPRQVYYAERADGLIKIGSSINPVARCKGLKAELLAVEAADASFERERVAQVRFKHLRVEGEWFNPGPDLIAHMATLVRNEPIVRKANRWADFRKRAS